YFTGTLRMLIDLCRDGQLACSESFEEELVADNITGVSNTSHTDANNGLWAAAAVEAAGGIAGLRGIRGGLRAGEGDASQYPDGSIRTPDGKFAASTGQRVGVSAEMGTWDQLEIEGLAVVRG